MKRAVIEREPTMLGVGRRVVEAGIISRLAQPRTVRYVAERVGFEPTSQLLGYTLSKRAPSATRTPLRFHCGGRSRPARPTPANRHHASITLCSKRSRGGFRPPLGEVNSPLQDQTDSPPKLGEEGGGQNGQRHLNLWRNFSSRPKTPFWSRTPSNETLSLNAHSTWIMRYCEAAVFVT